MTARMTVSRLTTAFAEVLGCKKVETVQPRLIALGHETVCGRCCGSGHYSYNAMYGTTCFGCGGAGKVATKLTPELLERVRGQVANGELTPYLDRLRATAAAKRKVAGFMDRLMAAWKANPTTASEKGLHWSKCSYLSYAVDCVCAPLHKEARDLVKLVEQGEWVKDRGYVPVSNERQEAAVARLNEILPLVRDAEVNLIACSVG